MLAGVLMHPIVGRRDALGTIRHYGGLAPFCSIPESPHDIMGAGHASTSIGYAVGLKEGMRLRGEPDAGRVVADERGRSAARRRHCGRGLSGGRAHVEAKLVAQVGKTGGGPAGPRSKPAASAGKPLAFNPATLDRSIEHRKRQVIGPCSGLPQRVRNTRVGRAAA